MSKKILLADDSVTIRKIVELTFGDSGYRVESVGSGAEALARFESMRPDLVVADVTMPGPDGYDVCRSIKLSAHPVPVLLLAGTFERYDEQAAEQCAADAYLTKPFDPESLVRLVDVLISTPPVRIEPGPGDGTSEVVMAPTVAPPTVAPPEVEIVVDTEGGADRLDPTEEVEALPEADVEPEAANESTELQASDISALAREVVRLLSDEVVRDIARQIVPEVAERVVRERIRELESDES